MSNAWIFLPPPFVVSVEGRLESYEEQQGEKYQAQVIAILVNEARLQPPKYRMPQRTRTGKTFGIKTFGKGSVQSVVT